MEFLKFTDYLPLASLVAFNLTLLRARVGFTILLSECEAVKFCGRGRWVVVWVELNKLVGNLFIGPKQQEAVMLCAKIWDSELQKNVFKFLKSWGYADWCRSRAASNERIFPMAESDLSSNAEEPNGVEQLEFGSHCGDSTKLPDPKSDEASTGNWKWGVELEHKS